MFRFALALLFAGALAGCSHDVSKSAAIQPGDGEAVVALGLIMPEARYSFSIARFDPATKTVLAGGDVTVTPGLEYFRNVEKLRYHVTEIAPGHYILASFTYRRGYFTTNLILTKGTLEFTIQPGVVNYIGDIGFDDDMGLKTIGRSQDGLAAYISAELPNVKLPIQSVPSQMTAYQVK